MSYFGISKQGRATVGVTIFADDENETLVCNTQCLACILFDHEDGNTGLPDLENALE